MAILSKTLLGTLCLSLALAATSCNAKTRPLSDIIAVIDAGHGGTDPGSHGIVTEGHAKKTVYEAPYVGDVAMRLAASIRAEGGTVILTRHDPFVHTPNHDSPSEVLAFTGNHDRYTIGGSPVRARTIGMLPRIAAASVALRKYPKQHPVFISIHFDIDAQKDMQGAHLITVAGKPWLAVSIANELRTHKRLRTFAGHEYLPVQTNGDRRHAIRDLYILDGRHNPIHDRVLIELGNFSNPHDVYGLRDWQVRQDFARTIAAGLIAYARNSPK